MAAVVASLSDRGWLSGPTEKLDQLLSDFYTTDYVQTYLYKDSTTNAQALFQQYGNDPATLAVETQRALDAYLKSYFDNISVQVTQNGSDDTNPTNKVTVTIGVTVVQDGQQYSIQTLAGNVNSKFQRITNYIDTGSFT